MLEEEERKDKLIKKIKRDAFRHDKEEEEAEMEAFKGKDRGSFVGNSGRRERGNDE